MTETTPGGRILEFQRVLIDIARSFLETEPDALDQGILEAINRLREAVYSPCLFFSLLDEDGERITKTYLSGETTGLSGPKPHPSHIKELGLSPSFLRKRRIDSSELAVPTGSWPCCYDECPHAEDCKICLIDREKQLFGILGYACTDSQWCSGEETADLLLAGAEILCNAIRMFQTKIALRTSQERLELAQWAGRSVAWDWDPETDRMYMSKSAAAVYGYDASVIPLTGTELQGRIPREDRPRVTEAIRRSLKLGIPYAVEHRFLMPDDETILWISAQGRPIVGSNGKIERLTGVSIDISEKRKTEAILFEEQLRAQVTLNSVAEGVIRVDAECRVDYLNPAAEALCGWSMDDALGRPVTEILQLLGEKNDQDGEHLMSRCVREARTVRPMAWYRLFHSSGREFAVQVSVSPLLREKSEVSGAVAVIQDLTELRKLEKERAFMARHDPLTGLLNRYEFERKVNDALIEASQGSPPQALAFLDLDTFKIINDSCGHLAGDEMLRQVSALLEATTRGTDILARIGGDEFGLLMKNCSLEDAEKRARDIIRAVGGFRFLSGKRVFSLGISLGIVPLDDQSPPFEDLLSAADTACYLAKEKGRNTVRIARPDDHEISRRFREVHWIRKINTALQKDGFLLHAQGIHPISNSGSPFMREFLLRMADGEEIISPTLFLGAAERYHMMPDIDRWVIHHALELILEKNRWMGRQDEIFTINLSGQSISQEQTRIFILDEIENSGIDPEQLCFEITETAAIANFPAAHQLFEALTARGCLIALDDFGSGLSSFRYLQELPIHFLKIDGSLVRDAAIDPIQRSMVAAIKSIADTMELKTIAEWVESKETLDLLRRINLDYAQGFFLDRPGPLTFDAP